MAGAHNSLALSQSDAIAEVVSAESCHIVLEMSPPDYVEKISRYLESSVGQSTQDKVSNEPAQAESDSGDSLFITQKPVPEAERTRRRRQRSLRSNPTPPRELEESESDASSSDSHRESKTDKERRRKCRPPKYSFRFLSRRKGKHRSTPITAQQNISFNNYTMGGFFKCVREKWSQANERGYFEDSSPVDTDEEFMSPLSEEGEEERSENEDIRVVERKCFLAPSKAKSQKSWCNQLEQRQNRRKALNARRETRQRGKKAREKADDDVHDISRTEDESDSRSDTSSYSVCDETRVEKKKNKKKDKRDHERAEEEERGLSQEEPEGLHAATSVNVEVEETPSMSEDDRAEPPASNDELEFNERNCLENLSHDDTALRQEEGDVPDSQQKKKKKRRKKSAGGNVREEVDGNMESHVRVEDSGFSESYNVEYSGKKKKERKRSGEDVEQLQSSADAEPLKSDAEIQKKKRTRKKEKIVAEEEASNRTLETGRSVENTATPEETLESSYGKRKNHKKKKKPSNDAPQDGEEDDNAATLEESTGMSPKKKKKKKKPASEGLDISYIPEENESVENEDKTQQTKDGVDDQNAKLVTKKKKKKKKKNISEGLDISYTPEENERVENEDKTQQTKEGVDDQNAELVTKKKKKKKNISEGLDISYTPEENGKFENEDTQETYEGLEDQNAEQVTKKKKKKKKSEISSSNTSEDKVAQSDDLASARKKEKKKRTSSFLIADAEENDAQTHGEQNCLDFETESAEIAGNLEESNDGVRKKKKKRKRKMSEEHDSMEKDHKQDFKEPNETCGHETTDTGVKRKKKRKLNESESVTPVERLESAADAGLSPTDEAEVLKKKKKSKGGPRHVIQESPPTAAEDKESQTPGNQTLNAARDKKKRKKVKSTDDDLLQGKAVLEPQENRKKERNKRSAAPNIISNSPTLSETVSEMSFSDSILKNKHKKVRRIPHNPSEDFLTDY